MKTKTIFCIVLLSFVMSMEHDAHAMLVKKTCKSYAKSHSDTFTRSCTMNNHQQTGIQNYHKERDEKAIRPIAYKNAHKLTSDVTEKNRANETDNYIMPTLNEKDGTISKVYLYDGKTVGFINYCVREPLLYNEDLKKNVPGFGLNAYINFLAIDEEYQRKGIGNALMQDALDDLKSKSVNYITLGTTGMAGSTSSLGKFYGRFGFVEGRCSKYTGAIQYNNYLSGDSNNILICKATYKLIKDWLRKSKE